MEDTLKMQENNPLATAPISKLFMQFAIPAVLSMLVDALYNMVYQIFIGQGVGWYFVRQPHSRHPNHIDCSGIGMA